jgi:integrase
MASTYIRGGKIWMRVKDDTGKWVSRSTGYSVANAGEARQARLMVRKEEQNEQLIAATLDSKNDEFKSWVQAWLQAKYAGRGGTTFARYSSSWRTVEKFLTENKVTHPRQVNYALAITYLDWRAARNGSRNTALSELKMLGMILDEAKRRNFCDWNSNPCQKLGLKKDKVSEKSAWTDKQISTIGADLEKNHFGTWMHVTFLLGLYQAARLMQAQIPMREIDFKNKTISYPAECVKGGKAFTQPLADALIPTLKKVVAQRTAKGEKMLCEIPFGPSIIWRQYLDGFGYTNLSHHGLRVTWATRAAIANVPMSKAMTFCNHSSEIIHRIYQKLTSQDISGVTAMVQLPSF